MNKFSERLKELREEAGLSQKELAEKLNNIVSSSAIGFWELGKREPSFSMVMAVARFFNVTLEYLAGWED